MRNLLRVSLAAFASIALSATSFAGGPFGIIHVGKWQGAAYTTDKGAFFPLHRRRQVRQRRCPHHCGKCRPLLDHRRRLSSRAVSRSPVSFARLTFDGQAHFEIQSTAGHETVVGKLPSPAINALRKSHLLVATANKQTLQFDLTAAGNVVPSIENCVEQINTNGIASAGDFSNPKAKPSKASARSDDEAPEKPSEPDKLVSVSGTGFVVSKNAHIVTNNHVVADCVGDIHGNLAGQAPVKLRVVSADEENDLALLQGPKKFKEKDIATIRASAVNSGD
jgi:S1-C subfamily serine protease